MHTKTASRRVLRFSTVADIREGTGSRGPKPIGWIKRFKKSFTRTGCNQCWEWTGQLFQQTGYGSLSIANVPYLAHRLAFLLANGRIDPDLLVMHSCDNRRCVNPAHLSQGTDADNVDDCVRKGRNQKGQTNGMAKLTETQVMEIIEEYRYGASFMTDLAKEYGVRVPCISRIVNGKRWKHLT